MNVFSEPSGRNFNQDNFKKTLHAAVDQHSGKDYNEYENIFEVFGQVCTTEICYFKGK